MFSWGKHAMADENKTTHAGEDGDAQDASARASTQPTDHAANASILSQNTSVQSAESGIFDKEDQAWNDVLHVFDDDHAASSSAAKTEASANTATHTRTDAATSTSTAAGTARGKTANVDATSTALLKKIDRSGVRSSKSKGGGGKSKGGGGGGGSKSKGGGGGGSKSKGGGG